jgi:hypothetical protein
LTKKLHHIRCNSCSSCGSAAAGTIIEHSSNEPQPVPYQYQSLRLRPVPDKVTAFRILGR